MRPCWFWGPDRNCAAKLRSDPKNRAAREFFKCFRPLAQVIRAQAAIELVAAARQEPGPESESAPSLPNPCECAEERSFKRIRASDCLSAASSSSTPLEASTGRCPQRSGGSQTPGSPFLLLTLLLAKQKKSESPAAATERHPDLARCMLVQSKNKGAGVKSPISHERSWGQEELGSDTVLNPYFFSAKS